MITVFLIFAALFSSVLSTVGGLMLVDPDGSRASQTFGWFAFFIFMFATVALSYGAAKL